MAPKRQPIKHGTIYAYKARGCRCKKCRRANADACRDYNRSCGAVPAGQPCETADGRRFRTQSEAAAALGVNKSTITYHLNLYGNLDRVGTPAGSHKGGNFKPVSVGTRSWRSRTELAAYLGVSAERVYSWISNQRSDLMLAALMRADTLKSGARQ